MENTAKYIEENKGRFLKELFDFLSIKSISSQPQYKHEVKNAAKWVEAALKNAGIPQTEVIKTEGHPIVYGEYNGAGPGAKTILIYGHYDVQPVDPLRLWKSDPFQPVIAGGKIYARGASDDKGQLYAHIKAAETLTNNGGIPVNLKFLIEGEEEAGSSNLDKFIEENKEKLKCSAVLISDTEWFADETPSICYALRGICYMEFTVIGPRKDLHSGTYGGAVDNPLSVISQMCSQLKDRYGRVAITGFYDDVEPLTAEERAEFQKLPFNEADYCRELGIPGVHGEFGFSTLERTWSRPSLDLNGIFGGFTEEGAKTVLPSQATAKLSMRLVANQKADDIARKTTEFLKRIAPPTVSVSVKKHHSGNPVLVKTDNFAITAAKDAMKSAFGKSPVFMREGGSIPIVEVFDRELNAPVVLLGLPGDDIHSPNESFSVENFYGGIKASAKFMENLKD